MGGNGVTHIDIVSTSIARQLERDVIQFVVALLEAETLYW